MAAQATIGDGRIFDAMVRTELQPITRSKLAADLKKLGVRSSDTIMLHASVKAIGWIVGGPDVVIHTSAD